MVVLLRNLVHPSVESRGSGLDSSETEARPSTGSKDIIVKYEFVLRLKHKKMSPPFPISDLADKCEGLVWSVMVFTVINMSSSLEYQRTVAKETRTPFMPIV